MNAIEAILSRKSSPRLQEPSPNEQELELIYKAALRAPDHGALKPWKFINVSGDGRKKLADAALRAIEISDPENAKRNKEKILNAPFRAPLIIIVIASVKEDSIIPEIEQILSAGAAAQNILIASHSLGYSAIWRTGFLAFNKEVSRSFGLDKSDIVVGYLYIGSTDKKLDAPEISNINDFVYKWSAPFSRGKLEFSRII